MKAAAFLVCASLLTAAPIELQDAKGRRVRVRDASRIVAIGASAGEILSALGVERRLVAVGDNPFPPSLQKLPQVSARHSVSAEGVISQAPTVVVAPPDAKPEIAFEQIERSGIPVVFIPGNTSVAALEARVRLLAQLVGEQQKGDAMLNGIRARIERVHKSTVGIAGKKRVLFLMSAGRGLGIAGGKGTPVDTMIRLAGGINAVTQFEGFKTISPEALSAINPDMVLVPGGGHGFDDPRALLREPGLDKTRAAKTGGLFVMELLYLMGYGPRMASAVQDLAHCLYPDIVPLSGDAPQN